MAMSTLKPMLTAFHSEIMKKMDAVAKTSIKTILERL